MDSTTLLYNYSEEIALAVSFNYGSKHNDREFKCAKYNTEKLGIEHVRIDLRDVFSHFKSDLLISGDAVPNGHYNDENMVKTVVPFRNGVMLSIAAGIAASKGLDTILIGNHSGDHTIYPDCRESFIGGMNYAIDLGLWEKVTVYAPYVNFNKRYIAELGRDRGIDYSHTYTCYKGGEYHCGICGACTERKEALAGFDNTVYME